MQRQRPSIGKCLFQDNKTKIRRYLMPSKGIITADNANFLLFDHIFHYFSEQQIDALLLKEPKTDIDPYQKIGDKSMYFVFMAVRYIRHIQINQPIKHGTLGLLVKNK